MLFELSFLTTYWKSASLISCTDIVGLSVDIDLEFMAATNGDERVIATAHHIVRTLGTDELIADDMLRILSNFDGRFSSMNHRLDRNREIALRGPPVELSTMNLPSLEIAEHTVMKWDMISSKDARRSMIWECQGEEATSYLDAVDELQGCISSLSISRRDRSTFDRAQSFLQLAMARLEEEFRHLLVKHSDSVDPEWILESVMGPFPRSSGDEGTSEAASRSSGEDELAEEEVPAGQLATDLNFTIDLLPGEVVTDLHDIARRMIAGGYGRECCQVYASVRKAVLQQSLYRLGVEKLSKEDIHKMTWESLEERIKKWVQALKVAVKVLYSSEKILCGQVFAGMSPCRETSFSETTKGSMMQLLSFAEAIAGSRRSPEKLFKILDMYETLWELLPEIISIFSDDICTNVRSEVHGILVRLGEAARATFAEFENAIQRDSSKVAVPRGAVHPLTRYVMNYIWLLFSYSGTLKRLLGDKKEAAPKLMGMKSSPKISSEDENTTFADHLSPLAVQIIWLTVLLECNLDGKSKLYKDIAQTYLFLMNNVHYIVQKVKQSELATLVGEDWVRKHSGQVRQYATNYVRAAWKKVLACLRDDGLTVSGSFSSGISKMALKERFKSFNAAFEELHRTQSTWVVPDPLVREELRLSIAEKLIPAYRCFSCRFQKYLETRRQPGKYIKYTPEDLESCLLDLFEGTSGPAADRRKSFSTG